MKKLLITLAVLTVMATPAFAQSFDPEFGSGNVLSFRNGPTAPQNDRVAIHRNGLNARAMAPRTHSATKSKKRAGTGDGGGLYDDLGDVLPRG
jgi:hypothetical protein